MLKVFHSLAVLAEGLNELLSVSLLSSLRIFYVSALEWTCYSVAIRDISANMCENVCFWYKAMHNSVRVSFFFFKLQIYLVFSIGKWIISQIFTRYQANDYKLVEEFSQIFTEMGFSMLEAFKWSM